MSAFDWIQRSLLMLKKECKKFHYAAKILLIDNPKDFGDHVMAGWGVGAEKKAFLSDGPVRKEKR